MIGDVFAAHGRLCARRPWEVILGTGAVTVSIMSMSVFTGLNRVCGFKRQCPDRGQSESGADGVVLILLKCLALFYIYLQFSKLRKLGSKYLLGVAGLFTVFSSFVFSTVVVDLIGNNLSGLNEALPFFLLLIDLSRASALARFVMSSKSKCEVVENIAHGMKELGPAITLDCLVEGLVTGVGSLSGVPRLQTMCCYGCLSIVANYCAFMTFYPACLALVLEISQGRSDGRPAWQINQPAAPCPVEELKPNPVTQRVKLMMSAGLLLVHVHRGFLADKSSLDDDLTELTLTSDVTLRHDDVLNDDVTLWDVFSQRAWALRIDTIVTLVLAVALLLKYTLYDSDSDYDHESDDGSRGRTGEQADNNSSDHLSVVGDRDRYDRVSIGCDDVDNMPIGYAKSESALMARKNAVFTLGDSDDETVETDTTGTQTVDDVNNVYHQNVTINGDGTSVVMTSHPAGPPRSLDECVHILNTGEDLNELSDDEVILLVKNKHIPAYKLESVLAHHERGVAIRRKLISENLSKQSSLYNLPYRNYSYEHVDGACCENVIGYMPVPVGVAGPLLLDGEKYYVPMATTEGCLVASTNRGCRALSSGDGVSSTVIGDGMSRAPVCRLPAAVNASEVKAWLETPENFHAIKRTFDSTSRFARLKRLQISQTGRLLFIRFVAVTGDAMGMNMLSKGSEKAMKKLREVFPDLEILSLSGNYCTDKKPSAVNWIEGRGKSVVCEAVVPGHVITTVLKTSVPALLDLNQSKNLVGSAMAGSIGGFNAHAANVVTAMFIACGQDAAQTVASSQCMTLMEASGEQGEDLYITCTMPCLEVGTVGGGTVLPPQKACLEMLGCQGSSRSRPGENAARLARVVCATVLAGELSLMSALAAGHLVRSHLRHNRSMTNMSPTRTLVYSLPSAQSQSSPDDAESARVDRSDDSQPACDDRSDQSHEQSTSASSDHDVRPEDSVADESAAAVEERGLCIVNAS